MMSIQAGKNDHTIPSAGEKRPEHSETPEVSRVLYQGRRFRFEELTTTNPDGRTSHLDAVRGPGAVVVIACQDDGMLLMIRNRRRVVGRTLWEFCAGGIEDGEDPSAAAARELEEEVGFRARRLERLCSFYTSPGFCDERMHAFAAFAMTRTGQRLEAGEEITVHAVSTGRVWEMVESGELEDAKSIAAFGVFCRKYSSK